MIGISKPKLSTCWFCEKPKSAAASRAGRAVCAACDRFMQQGVICIGVTCPLDSDTMIDKIYRDGNWCVLSRDECERRFHIVPPERFMFVTPERWFKAALPKFGKHGASHTENTNSEVLLDAEEETIA